MNELVDFPYDHVLVLGLAKSGTAAASLLLHSGKKVRINDGNPSINIKVQKKFQQLGAEFVLGSHPLSVVDGIDLVVKNPGIRYDHPIVQEAEKKQIPIITEVELAAHIAKDRMIGITGSNGKTTTTTLVTEMLEQDGKRVKVAGNIGVVASEVAETLEEDETMVVELSSFQLLGTKQFKPHIAVLLNLFHAHLDYHGTMDAYVEAKKHIFSRQTADDLLIYNLDQPRVVEAIQTAKSKMIPFSIHQPCKNGAWIDDECVYYQDEQVVKLADIRLVGDHNLENILAAVCAVKQHGVTNKSIRHVLMTFTGVAHRLQYVTTINQRMFYNDSKATNLLATEKALASFSKPVVLLAGGLDRGDSYESLIPSLKNVRSIVTFGETADQLLKTGKKAGIKQCASAQTMEEAVQTAYELSNEGDVILLSPACASWDQYATFEERGDMFTNAVHTLA